MRQSILKAFGISEPDTFVYEEDLDSTKIEGSSTEGDSVSRQGSVGAISSDTIISSTPPIYQPPPLEGRQRTVTVTDKVERSRSPSQKSDENELISNSNNSKAPTNTFRERNKLSSSEAEISSFNVNKMLTANEPVYYPGEELRKKDALVSEWNGYSGHNCDWISGVLYITNYRIIFRPHKCSTYDDVHTYQGSNIPLGTIHKVEKTGGKTNKTEHTYLIELATKDLRHIKFSFMPANQTRGSIFNLLREENYTFFCYNYKLPATDNMLDGWKLYDPEREFTRQGLFGPDRSHISPDGNPAWRLSAANVDYKMCETYSAKMVVPADMTDEEILATAGFRSKGRIPVLSWWCRDTGVSLTRSAQPLIGFNLSVRNKKFKDDHRMIQAILHANPSCKIPADTHSDASGRSPNPNNVAQQPQPQVVLPILDANGTPMLNQPHQNGEDRFMIVDLRPRANAEVNRVIHGAGYEKNYKDCELQFLNIANIHVVRASYFRLSELCLNTGGMDPQWYSKAEATNWLDHVRTILVASQFVTTTLQRDRSSILCHCSDGWDRTSQVVCLSQMMLDPYFRTMEGFAVLVEKEWLAYGHQFHKRCGHGSRNSFNFQERGPIFIQYLDCVFQLIRQHPTAFEYNNTFLMFVADELYNCRFGTFLYDCERERMEKKVPTTTPSLWTYLLNPSVMLNEPTELQPNRTTTQQQHVAVQNQFFNPFYDPDSTKDTLMPDLRHANIRFWTSYWLRYAKDPLGYQYHHQEPDQMVHKKAMEYLSDMNVMQDYKSRVESKNEHTVQTFQKEFRNMYQEIDELKSTCQEWKTRHENDTQSLMLVCEKQRQELERWSSGANGMSGATLADREAQLQQQEQIEKIQMERALRKKDDKVSADRRKRSEATPHYERSGSNSTSPQLPEQSFEQLREECDSWKQKFLDLQVELLQKNNHERRELLNVVDNQPNNDVTDQELERMKGYVLQLQGTIMRQRQYMQQRHWQENEQSTHEAIPPAMNRVDSWESVNDTWRTVSENLGNVQHENRR